MSQRIKRINNYLLTHYPLVWNTRLLWVTVINLCLHVFFFISGFSAISAGSIARYYSVSSVGGSGLYSFAALCGLLVLIVWCIHYLRNNAFKNFYRIGKWYLAKEFLITCFLIGTSITYFLSYEWGVRTRVRSITNQQQMVQEANAVNAAAVYLPYEKAAYFVLNSCAEKDKRDGYNEQQIEINSLDTNATNNDSGYRDTSSGKLQQDAQIRAALRRPDAFSYLHYCTHLVIASGVNSETEISERNRRWLQQGRKDSVRAALQSLLPVLKKYGIDYQLITDSTLRDIFSDPLFSVNTKVEDSKYSFVNGYEVTNPFYLGRDDLEKTFHLIDDCQLTSQNYHNRLEEWLAIGYITLGVAILLLCYRRFSRKVFLTSVVSTLLWAILLGLLTIGIGSSEGFVVMLLILSVAFLGVGLVWLRQKRHKGITGVLLNWHAYLAPFTLPLIAELIQLHYEKQRYAGSSYINEDAVMQQQFPISYWVTHHFETIITLNLIVSAVYIAILFNHWVKQWQAAPDE